MDTMELNGKSESIETGRIATVLAELRKHAQDFKEGGKVLVAKKDWKNYKIRIQSHNNFPTAAGLASSASGLACLSIYPFHFIYANNFQTMFGSHFPHVSTCVDLAC